MAPIISFTAREVVILVGAMSAFLVWVLFR
jgi:hypothetical protein